METPGVVAMPRVNWRDVTVSFADKLQLYTDKVLATRIVTEPK